MLWCKQKTAPIKLMRKPNKELVEPLCVDAHPAVWYMYKYLSIHLFDLPRAFARAEDGQTLLATYVAWTPTDLKGLRTTARPFHSAKISLPPAAYPSNSGGCRWPPCSIPNKVKTQQWSLLGVPMPRGPPRRLRMAQVTHPIPRPPSGPEQALMPPPEGEAAQETPIRPPQTWPRRLKRGLLMRWIG